MEKREVKWTGRFQGVESEVEDSAEIDKDENGLVCCFSFC